MPLLSFRRRSYVPYVFEVIAAFIGGLLYRVKTVGGERVPATGGVLILANHLSYVDVVVLQMACPRRLRYVGYRGLRGSWFFDWVFKMAGVIPITRANPTEGMRRAVKALQAGEAVCVFPEGEISRTGQLMEVRKGFEVMARRANVPVVAAGIDGLWGSVFSFAGNRYIWKSPRLMPTDVCVVFSPPMTAEQATSLKVRQAMLDAANLAFDERPLLKRHLGREVLRSLARRPGRVVLVDRTGDRRELKAAQLIGAVGVLAKRLRASVPEKRVGIVLPPGAGGFIANLAVMAAGKVPVNLNFTTSRAALESSLKLGGINTVITANLVKAKVPGFPWPERTVDLKAEIDAAGGTRAMIPWVLAAWVLPNQMVASLFNLPRTGDREEAGLLFTSGSSGEPKGVALSHRNILANCAQISSLSILPRESIMLGCLPLFHSFGFTVTMWYPLLRSCGVVTVPSPLDTRKIIDAIHHEGATVLIAAPTFMRPILKKATPGELRTLELVVTGAEKLPEDLQRAFLENFHLDLLQGYGLTETTPLSSVNQHNPPMTTETAELQLGKKPGAVGRLAPGVTARIVDPETYEELPLTSVGMVLLKGANVFGGYLNDPEKTRGAFRDGWFVTGDLGRFDDDGFLYIEGRLTRFSKIGGEMVPHGTVEQKIISLFEIDQAEGYAVMIVGVPDAAKGEALVLLTTRPITAEQVRDKLLEAGLPGLWVPRTVRQVEKIPVLGTGKLDLRACRELARGPA